MYTDFITALFLRAKTKKNNPNVNYVNGYTNCGTAIQGHPSSAMKRNRLNRNEQTRLSIDEAHGTGSQIHFHLHEAVGEIKLTYGDRKETSSYFGVVETDHRGAQGTLKGTENAISTGALVTQVYLSSSNCTPKILALYYMQIIPPYNQLKT